LHHRVELEGEDVGLAKYQRERGKDEPTDDRCRDVEAIEDADSPSNPVAGEEHNRGERHGLHAVERDSGHSDCVEVKAMEPTPVRGRAQLRVRDGSGQASDDERTG